MTIKVFSDSGGGGGEMIVVVVVVSQRAMTLATTLAVS